MTYISLFSSAGVGCYGFKIEGFDCVATNELIERRLNIQKVNNKCKYDSGYICGDITKEETKARLYDEIELWKNKENVNRIDVVIATPPCQGMSVANHKKNDKEIVRNSLVVESIEIIKNIHPRFFIFENVPAFMKTICTDLDGMDKCISDAIENNLGNEYSYTSRVINFKDYGASSSRTRTLVIGVSKDYADEVSPFELYPALSSEVTLRQVIGNMKSLNEFGEIDPNDIYHSFRVYPTHMREWIHDLKEGQSAFQNEDDKKKPHQIIDGKIVINKNTNADKYKRNYWDKVGPCVHTRNDQLASQNTIHPVDDRVFSIRELMKMMTVPDDFRWSYDNIDKLNKLPDMEKRNYLKKEEINIRQSLGEAVPTIIFKGIAHRIKMSLVHTPIKKSEIIRIVEKNKFDDVDSLLNYIESNPDNLSVSGLSKVAELSNSKRTDEAAFFTNKDLITEMVKHLPDIEKQTVHILEPSAGVGNFIPLIAKRYEDKHLIFDLVDVDPNSLRIASILLNKYGLSDNCEINYIVDDFLIHSFSTHYDIVVGNPPFYKMKKSDRLYKQYQQQAINKVATNICSFFLDKVTRISDYIAIVFPKFILNTPEFAVSRDYLSNKAIECILDFGEKGFPGVLIETLALFINNKKKAGYTRVISLTLGIDVFQKQKYIFDRSLPYWVIYRNDVFDTVSSKLDFGKFNVFRDRQITTTNSSESGDIRVIKARNISDDGQSIIDIHGYDTYIDEQIAQSLTVYGYLNRDDVYLTPNMTYYPRVMKKPKNTLVNGSVAILIPKEPLVLSDDQCRFFSSEEFRLFYRIARNHQTRSLNVDAYSVFFYGILREEEKVISKNTVYIQGSFFEH